MIITIDPGLEYFASATWEDGSLKCADFYDIPSTVNTAAYRAITTAQLFDGVFESVLRNDCRAVVFECPVIYPKSKAPPQDIMHLYGAVIAMAQMCDRYFVRPAFVAPREWKGNVPKEIFGKRIESKLTDRETRRADLRRFPKTKRHDVVDAIGLGLWYFGRLK